MPAPESKHDSDWCVDAKQASANARAYGSLTSASTWAKFGKARRRGKGAKADQKRDTPNSNTKHPTPSNTTQAKPKVDSRAQKGSEAPGLLAPLARAASWLTWASGLAIDR